MTSPSHDPRSDLTPPSPRRTDDAFARAVRSDVAAARAARAPWRLWVAAPLTAAMALGLVAISRDVEPPSTPSTPDHVAVVTDAGADDVLTDNTDDDADDGVDVAAVAEVVDDSDDDTLLALAGDHTGGGSDLAPAFAFADLDGSTEQDLAAVEAALDKALARL